MWFLVRVAFWLSIVILLRPAGHAQVAPAAPQVATADALSAAGAAVADMRQFCARQPDACAVGSQAAVAFGHKAQASAKMIYEFLTEKLGHEDTAPAQAPKTTTAGAAGAAGAPAGEKASQNTLNAADRAPAWRGPQSRPEMLAKRSA
jgi:hypothetical protein